MKNYASIYLTKFNGLLFLRTAIAFSVAFVIMAVHVAHADIYKYVDKEGVLHLTNMPTDHNAKYVMIMREKRILFQPNLDVNKYDDLITKPPINLNLILL